MAEWVISERAAQQFLCDFNPVFIGIGWACGKIRLHARLIGEWVLEAKSEDDLLPYIKYRMMGG